MAAEKMGLEEAAAVGTRGPMFVKLPYVEIEEGIYEIDEFDCGSIFVVTGKERSLLIDTGTGIGDLRWVVENRITDKPYDVVISHAHGDHNGGAGFFDEVWVHEEDLNWDVPGVCPSLEFRRDYAAMIAGREGKHYDYDPGRDIRPWEKTPVKKPLKDGHVFDLGGRKVTAYHVPGHTAGELVFLDGLSRTLLLGDACNGTLLLGSGFGKDTRDRVRIAREGLERLLAMKGQYNRFYNGHHDYRGFGQSLHPDMIEDAVKCYSSILDGTARFIEVPDTIHPGNPPIVAAEYGRVRVSCMDGRIDGA